MYHYIVTRILLYTKRLRFEELVMRCGRLRYLLSKKDSKEEEISCSKQRFDDLVFIINRWMAG